MLGVSERCFKEEAALSFASKDELIHINSKTKPEGGRGNHKGRDGGAWKGDEKRFAQTCGRESAGDGVWHTDPGEFSVRLRGLPGLIFRTWISHREPQSTDLGEKNEPVISASHLLLWSFNAC